MFQEERSILWEIIVSDLLSKNVYMNMCPILKNELPKQLEDISLATRIAMYFQHDGAPSYYTRHVMQHFN